MSSKETKLDKNSNKEYYTTDSARERWDVFRSTKEEGKYRPEYERLLIKERERY